MVTLAADSDHDDEWDAVALLHQTCDDHPDYHPTELPIERIVLGVLNTSRGDIEPVDCDGGTGFYPVKIDTELYGAYGATP